MPSRSPLVQYSFLQYTANYTTINDWYSWITLYNASDYRTNGLCIDRESGFYELKKLNS